MWKKWWAIVLVVLVIGIVGRSYYVMYAQAQVIKHTWTEVMKQYGQRSALVSDLSNIRICKFLHQSILSPKKYPCTFLKNSCLIKNRKARKAMAVPIKVAPKNRGV